MLSTAVSNCQNSDGFGTGTAVKLRGRLRISLFPMWLVNGTPVFRLNGKWNSRVHPSTSAIGLDVGITVFATLSDGTVFEPVNAYRKNMVKLAKQQRKLKRKKKFSSNWKKQLRRHFLFIDENIV